jgi:hypothetical protein
MQAGGRSRLQNFPEKPVGRHFMSKEHKPTQSMNKNITNEGQANSSTPKTKGLLPILICAAISAAALLCARFAATPLSFLNGASKASKTEREAQILKKAQARTAITNVTNDAERSLQEAQQRMEAKIDAAGSARFQREACAGELAEKCASIQNIAKMLYLLARDRAGVPAKETPEGFIQDLIAPEMQKFLAPGVDEVQRAVAEYQKFGATTDQSRAAKLKSEIAELQSPATEFPLVLSAEALAAAINQNVPRMIGLTVGAGMEIAFIRGTLSAAKRLCVRYFGKAIVRLAASGGLVVADGPLPIGDIVAVVMTAWTAVEVYQAKDDYRLAFKELILDQLHESEHQIKESGKQAIRTTHQEWTAAWQASSERLSLAVDAESATP